MVRQIVSLLMGRRKQASNDLIGSSNIEQLEILTGKLLASKTAPKGAPPSFYETNERKSPQGTSVSF